MEESLYLISICLKYIAIILLNKVSDLIEQETFRDHTCTFSTSTFDNVSPIY